MTGRIIKLTGGLYTVSSPEGLYECRARGIFRKNGISPVVGDMVEFADGVINSIGERKNLLKRPSIANTDNIVIVLSTTQPVPNFLLTDGIIAVAENEGIEPIIVITKSDIKKDEDCERIYRRAGLKIFESDFRSERAPAGLAELLENRITVFTGNSGAGKSTLLNLLCPGLCLETREISTKLGRGRHTTRHTELFSVCGGLVADTPGFSSFDIGESSTVTADKLAGLFREFTGYTVACRFSDCKHICEKGCAVIEAVNEGRIEVSRHESYKMLYKELDKIKDWMRK